jgi:cobalt/nickel transport system permease protein
VTCETFSQGRSIIHRLDPRGRVVVAVAFAVLIAVSRRFGVLGAGLALAVIGAAVARLPVRATLKRLRALNLFLLLFWLVVPLTTPGEALLALGPLRWSLPGVLLAARLTLKANAIVLMLTVLVGTVETPTLGHALHHLRVPDKLVHLLLFTVRYIDLIHHEYGRLRAAMRVRGFRPRMSVHTYRTFGNLVGMLLVRSFDRAERVVAAMKCRGFSGRFFLLTHFAFERRDALFAAASLVALLLLGLGEWA